MSKSVPPSQCVPLVKMMFPIALPSAVGFRAEFRLWLSLAEITDWVCDKAGKGKHINRETPVKAQTTENMENVMEI